MDRNPVPFEWLYDVPNGWGTDAHNTRLFLRNHNEELRASVEAVRYHFRILVKGSACESILRYREALRIQYAAMRQLPLQHGRFASREYITELNRVLRGQTPQNGLVSMLKAFERAAERHEPERD